MKLFVAFLALCGSAALAAPTVDEKVYSDLASSGHSTVILHFKAEHKQVLDNYLRTYRPHERSVSPQVLEDILRSHANQQQAETLALLRTRKAAKASGSDHKQLWGFNLLIVNDVDAELLELLKASEEIAHIEADRVHQLIDFGAIPVQDAQPQEGEQWGVKAVKAPEAWALNADGTGVVVGVTDTGIHWTHEVLRDNFRSEFGWRDEVNKRLEAYDDQGHGTHCSGSIVGKNGYGVAPNAQIIACKALSASGSGSTTGLLNCGQWMLCPTNAEGVEDCTKRPDVVSNSWGTTVSNTFYNNVIDTWRTAGMVGVFANGNSGQNGCKSTGSPADYVNALSVGATDNTTTVTYFSSRGPSTFLGTRKPDVAAPGAAIVSAGHSSDTSYATMSGTSMATPHVAGVVALLRSTEEGNGLGQEAILRLLEAGADETKPTGVTCGDIPDSQYPNNHVGYGIVNAEVSVLLLKGKSS